MRLDKHLLSSGLSSHKLIFRPSTQGIRVSNRKSKSQGWIITVISMMSLKSKKFIMCTQTAKDLNSLTDFLINLRCINWATTKMNQRWFHRLLTVSWSTNLSLYKVKVVKIIRKLLKPGLSRKRQGWDSLIWTLSHISISAIPLFWQVKVRMWWAASLRSIV